MQDLLGDVHDLDVFRGRIRSSASKLSPAIQEEWIDRIDAKRKALLQEFLQISAGPDSPWLTWRAGFQWGHALVAAPFPARRTA
jgi:hypothetical protein